MIRLAAVLLVMSMTGSTLAAAQQRVSVPSPSRAGCPLAGMVARASSATLALASASAEPVDPAILKIVRAAVPADRLLDGDQLCDLATEANRRLERSGYLAKVTLPPPADFARAPGLTIATGRIVRVAVRGAAGPYEWIVARKIAQIQQMRPVLVPRATRILYSLNDLPDLTVHMTLSAAGAVKGDILATVEVTHGPEPGGRMVRITPGDADWTTPAPAPVMPTPVPPVAETPAVVPRASPVAGGGHRIALLIGNADYPDEVGRLTNPVRDVRRMAERLASLGFQIEIVENGTREAMYQAIRQLKARLRRAGPGATGLFYYSGHGTQVEGGSYLIPVKSRMTDLDEVLERAVAADNIVATMDSADNAVNILILDACRRAPGTRGIGGAERGIGMLPARNGSFIAYSTAINQVAYDGAGELSPFAAALADEITAPDRSIEDVFKRVRARVLAATGSHQTPWESSSLIGDFSFNPRR